MSSIVIHALKLAALSTILTGCGLTQTVTDATSSTTRAIFQKQVKTLHLDFTARASANPDAPDMRTLSVPTVVRVYQLRTAKAISQASYAQLQGGDERALQADLLDMRALVVKPGAAAQLSMPVDPAMQTVAVVALFREPDEPAGHWRMLLTRDDLDPDRARLIELGANRLALRPLE